MALYVSFSKMPSKSQDFLLTLQIATETILTYRKRRKRIKKEKAKNKNFLLDWIEAFLWAAGMVLLINQYLFQAYQIPSGSMIDTLLIGDRIFVNKLVYGPELLPGLLKLPSPIKPQRNDIIIFENPAYISRGTAFDIAQRVIFMLTLSLVDIDRDEFGQPKPHFLIKRAVAMGGDQVVSNQGNLMIRFAGENQWVNESEYNSLMGYKHNISHMIEQRFYPALDAYGKAIAYRNIGLPIPLELNNAELILSGLEYLDYYTIDRSRLELLRAAFPHDNRYRNRHARYTQGQYIPENRILPLGDNMDNSHDGREFGPVHSSRVLGRGSMIHWPLNRIGSIH